ncbi:MAG: hypothetical protein OXE42_09090 [Gammaproteobacteria bacterium]|nr:hypothetical protein [Gammaproteobacteria bacterium]
MKSLMLPTSVSRSGAGLDGRAGDDTLYGGTALLAGLTTSPEAGDFLV